MNERQDAESQSPEEIDVVQAPTCLDPEVELAKTEEAPAQIPESDPEGRPTV